MLLVKTYLDRSKIHGIGLFAAEHIPQGSVVWKLNKTTTQILSPRQFIKRCSYLSKPAIIEMLNYSYKKNGSIYYLHDNTRFINHLEEPNLMLTSTHQEIAMRNIAQGEELTENYLQSYGPNDFFQLVTSYPLDLLDRSELIALIKEHQAKYEYVF